MTSATFLVSEPRYALTLFPIFILAGLIAGQNRFRDGIMTTASLLFLALFASLFVRGWWAFSFRTPYWKTIRQARSNFISKRRAFDSCVVIRSAAVGQNWSCDGFHDRGAGSTLSRQPGPWPVRIRLV